MRDHVSQLRITQAAKVGIPRLCELLTLLFTQETDFSPDSERQAAGLQMIIDQPHVGHIYCARDECRIIGMVSILFTVSIAEGARAALLEDMIVHPDWRGQGIGAKLLDEAIRRARNTG